jgi:low temperature requirement protein LtrA
MEPVHRTVEPEGRAVRVSTLELFFDLVFVFTITQFTRMVADEPNATGLAKVALLFSVALKPNVAYLVLNFCALWKKQTTLPSLAYAGIPYQVRGTRSGALAFTIA